MDDDQLNHFYKDSIQRLQHALFFCYDENNNKWPVSLVSTFVIDDSYNIWFNVIRPPLTYKLYNICNAELSFYKKGETYHLKITGFATVADAETMLIKFNIDNIECMGELQKEETDLQGRFLAFFRNIINPDYYSRNFRLG